MNSNSHNPNASGSIPGSGEETLRLIARLPAPEGLEDRVRAALGSAPRGGRLLGWPAALRPESGWMRAAAAAAIVFVIAGGGWGVYSRVQQGQPARIMVLPPRVPASGGFSSAGAMRTPQTLNGPVVARPVIVPPAHAKPSKKAKARQAAATARPSHSGVAGKSATPPATLPVK